jgi:hypothetical protein
MDVVDWSWDYREDQSSGNLRRRHCVCGEAAPLSRGTTMTAGKKRTAGKGDVRALREPVVAPSEQLWTYAALSGSMAGKSDAEEIKEHMLFFGFRDDGYLRYIPDGDLTKLYIKWKWTTGKWIGHYVMSAVDVHEISLGLRLLRSKVTEVDEGRRGPTKDRKVE